MKHLVLASLAALALLCVEQRASAQMFDLNRCTNRHIYGPSCTSPWCAYYPSGVPGPWYQYWPSADNPLVMTGPAYYHWSLENHFQTPAPTGIDFGRSNAAASSLYQPSPYFAYYGQR